MIQNHRLTKSSAPLTVSLAIAILSLVILAANSIESLRLMALLAALILVCLAIVLAIALSGDDLVSIVDYRRIRLTTGLVLIAAGLFATVLPAIAEESNGEQIEPIVLLLLSAGVVLAGAEEYEAFVWPFLLAGSIVAIWATLRWWSDELLQISGAGALTIGIALVVGLSGILRALRQWMLPSNEPLRKQGSQSSDLAISLSAFGLLSLALAPVLDSFPVALMVLCLGAGSFGYVTSAMSGQPRTSISFEANQEESDALSSPRGAIGVLLMIATGTMAWLARDSNDSSHWITVGAVLTVTLVGASQYLLAWKRASKQTSDLMQRLNMLRQESRTDSLTGLPNRRAVDQRLTEEIERSYRFGHSLSVAIADIDDFKQVNDTFGHAVGDQTLVTVSRAIESALRSIDLAGRYGGEEFVILLPETDHEGAQIAMNRVVTSVFDATSQAKFAAPVTVSVGVATILDSEARIDSSEILKQADEALYDAKSAGKNRVVSTLKT